MSVFTEVSQAQLETFLEGYELGRLVAFSGIAGGSENSNFFVSCSSGEYVLTLVERGDNEALPFFVELLECLHQAGLSVPYAIADRQGRCLQQLNGKPALLQPRLPGRHVEQPDPAHCEAVGRWLARLHSATVQTPLARPSERGLEWMLSETRQQLDASSGPQAELLDSLLCTLAAWQRDDPGLPRAVLHADLFRDNVMFDGHHLSGVIDFYNAASGWTLYDVAIAVNDWCLRADASLDPRRTQALLAGYASQRSFTAAEHECWPDMLRVAALRFWLSRQLAAQQHSGQRGVLVKDPAHFMQLLQQHRNVPLGLPLAL
ncbi:homoserine kinase [Halopseudomonas sabulinigri]|uniref:Homoserine kinase n=1 Tax=Halopseudomonas sabulinigri TaxID=472181 RepID=A0A1H1TCY9_9GAMM|nr:homoserine kinase [Halopseudomonas sabulinigri]SDS58083.1 homoserine kinase [Halopseudomonas sabulinigri]